MNYPAYGFGNTAEEAEKNFKDYLNRDFKVGRTRVRFSPSSFSQTRESFGPEDPIYNRTDYRGKVWLYSIWVNFQF